MLIPQQRDAKFDVRGAHTGTSASLSTKQLVDASDQNNLTVQLNETNTSIVNVISQNVQTNGQGLQLDSGPEQLGRPFRTFRTRSTS